MSKSTRKRTGRKPSNDFPLFQHATGRWAKKVRGKFCYFGKVADDPDGEKALARWLADRDYLIAGRTPPPPGQELLTVKDLCNAFLTAKTRRVESGEITSRALRDYRKACDAVVNAFGSRRAVADLRPADFEALRAGLAKINGPVRLGNTIQRVRTLFKWGVDDGLLDALPRYGAGFKKPTAKTLRLARAAKGVRMFEPSVVRALLDAAVQDMRAFILLAINGGFGPSDIATLPLTAIDLEAGWIAHPRPKTGIPRRCPLWPETVQALREAIASRPAPKEPRDAGLAFLTLTGLRLVRDFENGTNHNTISERFGGLTKKLGLKGGFYLLRHGFLTVAEATRDFPAVREIMGHSDASMAAHYREKIEDGRLRAVVDHVHDWLFGAPAGDRDDDQDQAPADTRLAAAVARARAAIKSATGPTRRTLESVWSPEIDNATNGDGEARRRLLEVWANERDDQPAGDRPRLRVVGGA